MAMNISDENHVFNGLKCVINRKRITALITDDWHSIHSQFVKTFRQYVAVLQGGEISKG